MRTLLLIAIILAFAIETADARKRRHRGHHGYQHQYVQIERYSDRAESRAARTARAERPTMPAERRATRARGNDIRGLVPADWRLQPPQPEWQGHRFISPRGDAWLALYPVPVDLKAVDQHWKSLAFVEGEELTYLQRERHWVAVSGFKGGRIFYRKAVLACGESQWRTIAFEYPADAKRAFDPLVNRMSDALDREANEDCDVTVGRN
jgi:hypothetical protein